MIGSEKAGGSVWNLLQYPVLRSIKGSDASDPKLDLIRSDSCLVTSPVYNLPRLPTQKGGGSESQLSAADDVTLRG